MTHRTTMPLRASGARPKVGSAGRTAILLRGLAAVGRVVGRRPGLVLAGVAVVGGGVVFGWNVLMKQPSAHPAPLFASAKAPVVPPVEPPRRPDFAGTPLARPEPASTQSVAKSMPVPPTRVASTDAIGSLIRTGEPARPEAVPPARPAAAEPKSAGPKPADPKPADPKANAPKVAATQKALVKLGYGPIEPDGVMGTITKQALERFERDRKLPVTGAMSQRTLKQLASLSGMRFE